MILPENYNEVKATDSMEFNNIIAGGYIAKIINAMNFEDKKYLRIQFDIVQGEFEGYYSELYKRFNYWSNSGFLYVSYKEKATGLFKWFIEKVEESNQGFKFGNDEKTLNGKLIGLVFGEEEYVNDQGEIKVACKAKKYRSIADIKNGNFEIPEIKKAKLQAQHQNSSPGYTELPINTELPF